MRPVVRLVMVCCLVCVALGGWSADAFGEGSSSADGVGSSESFENSLVVSGVQSLDEAQQVQSADEAGRSSPEAVTAREMSQTGYEGLNAGEAAQLAQQAFPGVIDRSADGPPRLAEGQHVSGFLSANAAQVDLGGEGEGVVESLVPFAKESSPGHWAPVDLSVSEVGGSFRVADPVVGLGIPRRLQEGVSLAGLGVSLTPVDASGAAVGGSEGRVEGSVVFYGGLGVGSDVDEIVKPTTGGFDEDTILRSDLSPEQLFYRVGLPAGASLVQAQDGSGTVDVIDEGTAIASVLAPSVQDAAGASVPVSITVRGSILTLTVAEHSSEFQYPIEVDPEVTDNQLVTTSGGKRSNWVFATSNASRFASKSTYEGSGKESLETYGIAKYEATEKAYWAYETQGESKIYEFNAETEGKNKEDHIESFLELEAHGTGSQENKELLSTELSEPNYERRAASPICPKKEDKGEQECLPTAGGEGNAVRFQQSTTAASSNYAFSDTLYQGIVSLAEPTGTHSTTGYNTSSSELEFEVEKEGKKEKQRRVNALYGSGGWLSEYDGALQFIAKDPGIGVSASRLEYEDSPGKWEQLSEHNYLESENDCQGVQCYPEHSEFWTLNGRLPNGEDKIRYRAEDAMHGTESPETEGVGTIKVDTAKPHGIVLHGLPYGNELSERAYNLTVDATDGVGSTVASSGVQSIELSVDKNVLVKTGGTGECAVAKGECTASEEWTINGAELGAGHHAIVVVVKDNAGNEARSEEEISIRHSTPVALGPGSVDLESGDLSLGATDVSMGSGLALSRNYSSRDLTEGVEGPLGPQWNLSMGNVESLLEMVDGSILMTAANGSQTIFAAILNSEGKATGKFESPPGDSNLTMTLEENAEKTQKVAYYLEDAAAKTKVKFTQPTGSAAWMPTRQEGAVSTNIVTYAYKAIAHEENSEYKVPKEGGPHNITQGPDGNLWFTDSHSSRIGKITTSGTITEYSLPEKSEPEDITRGPDGNLWFTDYGTGRIGKITTSGTITEYKLPERSKPEGITQGPDGNLWFTTYGKYEGSTAEIDKMTTAGTISEYALPEKSEPKSITEGPDGKLWFTDYGTSKIGKITTSGTIAEYSLRAGSDPYDITAAPDGNLWFTNHFEGNIESITTSGALTEYALPKGSAPSGITQGPEGNLWYTRVGEIGNITTSGAITEYSLPSGSEPVGDTIGPDGDVWFADPGTNKIRKISPRGAVVEPTEALAPVPTGVSCSWKTHPTEMQPGCRALEFKYASATTAKGEVEAEWGEYSGRLMKVLMVAYNPSSKEMQETSVAEYSYDKQGRLRAEWDPRVSPALKTTYGYDLEGHITAISPSGQEPWLIHYGTDGEDTSPGRVLGVSRPRASVALESGSTPVNTVLPTLSYSPPPIVGVTLKASTGSWSTTPLAYEYQWERCSITSERESCIQIPGATNQTYAPVSADVRDVLKIAVRALNADGATMAYSATSQPVQAKASPYYRLGGKPLEGSANVSFSSKRFTITMMSGYDTEISCSSASGHGTIFANGEGTISELAFTCALYGPGKCKLKKETKNIIRMSSLKAKLVNVIGSKEEELLLRLEPESKEKLLTTIETEGEGGICGYGSIEVEGVILGKVAPLDKEAETSEISFKRGGEGWYGYEWNGETGSGNNLHTAGGISLGGLEGGFQIKAESGAFGAYTSGTLPPPPPPNPPEPPSEPNNATWTIGYQVPVSGTGAPHNMSESEVAKWGQKGEEDPVEATAIFPPDEPQAWPASSYKRARIYYLDEHGRIVNTATPSTSSYGSIATTEYNETNDVIRTLSPANRVTALEAGSKSVEVSKLLDSQSTYNGEGAKENEVPEPGTKLIETLSPQHMIKYVAGKETKESLARNHTKYYYDEGAKEVEEKTHEMYSLLTKTSDLAQLANEEEVEVRKTTTSYSGQENLGWKLRAPTSTTVDPEGKKLTNTTLYNKITGQITETRGSEGLSGESAHDGKTIYYTPEANTEGYPGCGKHPEWVGLVCETLPAKQPETSGPPHPPKLPVTTITYNIWNEPESTTETFGSTTRTKTEKYDAAGRLTSSETTSTSTADKSLPKVTNEYNSKTGVLEVQSTTIEGKTQSVTSIYNALGQLESYKDADGDTTKYKYGGPEIDNQMEEVSDNQGKRLFSYEATTKALSKLWVSGGTEGMTFTANYNVEGKMTSEIYPNGMCANYTYNSLGEATGIQYIKTTNCTESKPTIWYSENVMSSTHGEVLSQESTLGSERYTYDTVGRLIETQETPTGESCKTRTYAYDEESNRTSLTTREPNSKKECATEGGTTEKHTYDEANRLIDTGVEYDPLGNITTLPAADAGEGGELKSTFYVDNEVSTQTQNDETIKYEPDPTGRVRRTVSEGKTKSTVISHYDAPGEAVAWTNEEGSEKSTRDIPGIDGTLSAIENSGSNAVLQLHDLQGDTVATAALSPSETKLLYTYNSTEFGVPNAKKPPPKYAFQGAGGATSELGTGIITYGATSYDPQAGKTLQSEEVIPPGLPDGSGAGAPYTFQEEPWVMQGATREANEAPGLEAGRELEAEEAALRACDASGSCDPPKTLYFDASEVAVMCGILDAEDISTEPLKVLELATTTLSDVEKNFIIDAIKEVTGLHSPTEWADSIDSDLHACLSVMTSGYKGQNLEYVRCAITTPWSDISIPVLGTIELPNFTKMPTASYCLYYSDHCGEYDSGDNAFLFPSGHLLFT